jgi:hypothetical protein
MMVPLRENETVKKTYQGEKTHTLEPSKWLDAIICMWTQGHRGLNQQAYPNIESRTPLYYSYSQERYQYA